MPIGREKILDVITMMLLFSILATTPRKLTLDVIEKTMEHEGYNYTIWDWCFCYSNKRIIKRTRGLGSWRTSGDHPNESIIDNGQNPEKSPGVLRRLAVTQTPVKDHQLTLMWKTLKEYNDNNKIGTMFFFNIPKRHKEGCRIYQLKCRFTHDKPYTGLYLFGIKFRYQIRILK